MTVTRAQAALALMVLSIALAAAGAVALAPPTTTFRVEGSVQLGVLPAEVASQLPDLRRWAPWGSEPGVRLACGGVAGEVGASCHWSGGARVGRGRLTLLAAGRSQVALGLEVAEPGAYGGDLTLQVSPDGQGTLVTWTLTGERPGWLRWAALPAPLERFDAQLARALLALEPAADEPGATCATR
jgi:hypothetical protein